MNKVAAAILEVMALVPEGKEITVAQMDRIARELNVLQEAYAYIGTSAVYAVLRYHRDGTHPIPGLTVRKNRAGTTVVSRTPAEVKPATMAWPDTELALMLNGECYVWTRNEFGLWEGWLIKEGDLQRERRVGLDRAHSDSIVSLMQNLLYAAAKN